MSTTAPEFREPDTAAEADSGADVDQHDEAADDSARSGGDDKDSGQTADDTDHRYQQARREAAERRRELKPWKDLARDFGLTPEQVRQRLEGNAPAGEEPKVDPDAIRREAERAAADRANQRIVRAEVKAAAADLFEDPSDAALYVDLSKFDVDDDGSVDEDEIRDELRAVLARKPHLAKRDHKDSGGADAGPRAPRADKSQGARGKTSSSGWERGVAEAERRFGKQTA